jgi:hypothetical protein
MKRLFLITVVILLTIQFGFSGELIDMGSSNQSSSTMGFEQNEYDWMLNPLDFDQIENSILFFSLDATANQFGAGTVGDGFRGGYAWIMDGFSPIFAANYRTTSDSDKQDTEEDSNVVLAYGTFDTASGRYATIDETVSITSSSNSIHELMFHFGGNLSGPLDFVLQTYWNMDREAGTSSSYTDQYTNTAAVSDASLASKGNLTEAEYDLIGNADNIISFEPEIGLVFGNIMSNIAIGLELYNSGAADDSWEQTVTSYSGGVDPTIMDSTVVTSNTGSYYYSGSAVAGFDMNTSAPVYVEKTLLNLNVDTTIELAENLELDVPVSFNMALYPDLSTVDSSVTTGFNDSTADVLESSRTVNTVTTNLTVDNDLGFEIGGTINKTIFPSENSALYIGAGTGFSMEMYSDTRNSTDSTDTKQDNDADGLYTTAGTDTDTTYQESGWEIQTQTNEYTVDLYIPVAVSYSPVKPLTFHAGTYTVLSVSFTDSSSLETGDNGYNYLYETYTDNLTATNSYAKRQKDGSDNINDPYSEFSTYFNFMATGTFGFTLEISDNFKIDALAQASSMQFNSFSLTGIYSHK